MEILVFQVFEYIDLASDVHEFTGVLVIRLIWIDILHDFIQHIIEEPCFKIELLLRHPNAWN